jgi:hypothetical protein
MLDELQSFLAVLLVIGGAVAIGGLIYLVIDICQGGIKRVGRERRCAMPKRIREGN